MKSFTSGGTGTKVIALGIGSGIDQSELEDIASAPQNKTVIVVKDFNDLTSVEEHLRNESCNGKQV